MMLDWILGGDPVDITNTSSTGAPWWVVIVASLASAVVAGSGAFASAWATWRRDNANADDRTIARLEKEITSLRNDLTALQGEVHNTRIRELAWIAFTSTLTRLIVKLGGEPPALPENLQAPAFLAEA